MLFVQILIYYVYCSKCSIIYRVLRIFEHKYRPPEGTCWEGRANTQKQNIENCQKPIEQ